MIICNPHISFGQPILAGRRLTVYDIVSKTFLEKDIGIVVSDYSISRTDIKDAAQYCMMRACESDSNLVHFCDGCILRAIHEGWTFSKADYSTVERDGVEFTIANDGSMVFLGNVHDLENEEFGRLTWVIAEDLLERYRDELEREAKT